MDKGNDSDPKKSSCCKGSSCSKQKISTESITVVDIKNCSKSEDISVDPGSGIAKIHCSELKLSDQQSDQLPKDSCCTKKEMEPSCCSSAKPVVCTAEEKVESQCKDSTGCCKPKTVSQGKEQSSCETNTKKPVIVLKEDTLVDIPTETVLFRVEGMTCTGCENTLQAALQGTTGVFDVEISMFLERAIITFDPVIVGEDMLLDVITKKAGFRAYLDTLDDVSVVKLEVKNSSKITVDQVLVGQPGVYQFKMYKDSDGLDILELRLDLDTIGARDIADLLNANGISVDLKSKDSVNKQIIDMELVQLAVAVLCSIPIVLLAWIIPDALSYNIFPVISIKVFVMWICATIVQFFVGYPVYVGAWNGLIYSKELNMDSLVVLSTTVAYVYSTITCLVGSVIGSQPDELFFETSVILMTLILLGRYLQSIARKKAADTLNGLKKIHGGYVTLVQGDKTRSIDIKWIQRRDLVMIRPGEYIPSDGMVVEGSGEVDESILTGESRAVFKDIGSRVIGGTLNLSGTLKIRITHLLEENVISHIAQLIQQAQGSKAKSQYLADKIAAWFTPFVVVISVIVYVVWYLLVSRGVVIVDSTPALHALGFAIAVLVVSCPCAVALAVPTVIVVGAGVAAKNGILIKNAEMFEDVCQCKIAVFDKTGTLTSGSPTVVDVWKQESSVDWNDLVRMIAAGTGQSLHPVAKAISKWCSEQYSFSESKVQNVFDVPGFGFTFTVGDYRLSVGLAEFVTKHVSETVENASKDFIKHGHTLTFVSLNDEIVAIFALNDPPRVEASLLIKELVENRYQVYMISGDNQETVDRVAQEVGIPLENAFGHCRPDDKLNHIKRLQQKGKVMFVGDGTNDAPVLAQAELGIAMGCATDIALMSSAIILLTNDLEGIQTMCKLSNQVVNRIKCNFGWAAVYNIIVIPLAAGVYSGANEKIRIPPALAGLGEIVSVMPVLIIALLLRRFRAK